ncbi:hypothetical protein [Paenibacillus larvae]|uniref:hypothetical protein n=1 Tax=Paenibacillus larvae TaxID=1464 RepID=UPI001304728D|nr:hypothetical protein [Paenibacillus larvae]
MQCSQEWTTEEGVVLDEGWRAELETCVWPIEVGEVEHATGKWMLVLLVILTRW